MREYPLQYASTDENKKSHYNILKSSSKFSMEKCTASGEDILFNNVNLATLKLWYVSMKEWMVIWISLYYT